MRLTKTVGQYYLGPGSLKKLDSLLEKATQSPEGRVVFLIDHFFQRQNNLIKDLPLKPKDITIYLDSTDEPTTSQVD